MHEIVSNDEDSDDSACAITAECHVHKTVLAFGPRRCGCFSTHFKTSNFAESQNQTSRIELHRLAADAFPQLLDYVYDVNPDLEMEEVSVTALHCLADRFAVRGLKTKSEEFLDEEIAIEKMHVFYQHVKILHNNYVLQTLVYWLGEGAV